MAQLVPVDHDPFAAAPSQGDGGPLRITVTPPGSEQRQPSLVPVDHDPFASPGYAEDIARSIPSGLAKGIGGLAGLPDSIGKGLNWIDRAITGEAPDVQAARIAEQKKTALLPDFFPTTEQATAAVQGFIPGGDYKPQTRPGRFAQTAAEFVPGAMLGPGSAVRNAVSFGVVPGLTSEAAGQLTEGTKAEPWARVAGGLAGGLGAAALSRPGTATQAVRAQLPEGVSPQMVDQASALIQDAAQRGITLSWPEALSQVAGRPVLTNAMRHLEAAPATEARMAEFFGPRAGQIETGARNAMDGVGPANMAPSTIGPAIGREAEGIANDVRGAINRHAQPHYDAAATVRLDPQEMAQVRAVPGFDEALNAVRGDPQLNRYVATLPDDSVGFLNEVKKYLDQTGQNASAPINQQRNMQRSAGYGRDAEVVRDAATRASPDYAAALFIEREGRQRFLQPLLDGPIGRIAERDLSTKKAIDALFPKNPLPHSDQEIAQTVGTLARRSPRVTSELVRAHIESTFNVAAKDLQSGANQMGGAKFRSVLVGNPQQRANFEAAVTALPNGAERLAGFNRFLDIMEATGARPNVGSRTAYNAELLKAQGASGLIGEAAKGATNPLGRGAQFLADKYERYRLGQNLNELADILTNPAAVNRLRAISRMRQGSPQAIKLATQIAMISRSSSSPKD